MHPVIPFKFQFSNPVDLGQFQSNSHSWLERQPVLKFSILLTMKKMI